MARYIDADDLILELSENVGELNAHIVGEAIGRVPTAYVISRHTYEAVLEELCYVRNQLERERQLVRDLITELGRRHEYNEHN